MLSGGTFLFTGQGSTAASPASVLRFRDADIVSNAADIQIRSARARIVDQFGNDALRHLAHNAAQGVLTFDHSGDYSTPGDFTNDGQIAMGGGTFTVTGALTNYANHALTGGGYRASTSQGAPGFIRINDADVITNAAAIDLVGPGSGIVDQFGNDALRHLTHNSVSGSFSIEGNVRRDIPGDFTNDGELRVRANAPGEACALTIRGNLSNFSGGTLTGGRFILDDTFAFAGGPTPSATLTFPGADIRTNSAYLYLGYNARINDENGNNGLRHFATNAAGGTLTIGWSASFVVPGPLTNAGRLELLYGSLTVPGALLSPGTINMQGGTLRADSVAVPPGGTLSNFGTIIGDVNCAGSLVVDDLANGALSIKGRLTLTGSSRTAVSYGTTPGIFLGRVPPGPYITVDGPVTLAGVLDFPTVLLVSGSFAPTPGDEFILIDATSLSGAFNNVANGGRITTDDGLWSFLVEYGAGANANRLVLTDATPVPEPAAAILLAGWCAAAFAGRRHRHRPASPCGGGKRANSN